MMAATLGARTSTMRIGTNIIVAGLHNPIRLAEDATALSLLTGNRFELGVGLGYRELEFSGFGRTVKTPAQPPRGRHRDHPPGMVRKRRRL